MIVAFPRCIRIYCFSYVSYVLSLFIPHLFLFCPRKALIRDCSISWVSSLIYSYIWRLFCHCLMLISPSFGALKRPCFVIVAFPGYTYLYFFFICGVFFSFVIIYSPPLLRLVPREGCAS